MEERRRDISRGKEQKKKEEILLEAKKGRKKKRYKQRQRLEKKRRDISRGLRVSKRVQAECKILWKILIRFITIGVIYLDTLIRRTKYIFLYESILIYTVISLSTTSIYLHALLQHPIQLQKVHRLVKRERQRHRQVEGKRQIRGERVYDRQWY